MWSLSLFNTMKRREFLATTAAISAMPFLSQKTFNDYSADPVDHPVDQHGVMGVKYIGAKTIHGPEYVLYYKHRNKQLKIWGEGYTSWEELEGLMYSKQVGLCLINRCEQVKNFVNKFPGFVLPVVVVSAPFTKRIGDVLYVYDDYSNTYAESAHIYMKTAASVLKGII